MQVVEVDSILYTCAYCSQIRQKKVNDGGGGGHFDMKLMNRLTLIIFRLCCKFFMQVNVINCCVQVLVACTPDGVLCYISRVYGGAASDKFITTDCGFLEHLVTYRRETKSWQTRGLTSMTRWRNEVLPSTFHLSAILGKLSLKRMR